jgi:hypothetical protein
MVECPDLRAVRSFNALGVFAHINFVCGSRWTCVLLGRPMTIINKHFDTQYPISETHQGEAEENTATENFYLPYLTIFRYTHLLGPVLEDLNNVCGPEGGMSLERATFHDNLLKKWRESWPRDLELTEYTIATSLARTQEEGVQRRGIQALHLFGV